VAVADSRKRESVSTKFLSQGAIPLTLMASSAIAGATSKIGLGGILSEFSSVTENVSVGRFFHANMYAYIAHDCVIGDYVTLGPRASINGNVHIADHVYIGSSAVIKQGTPENPIRIGSGAFIGMGAIVTSDVAPGAKMVGFPAKALPHG